MDLLFCVRLGESDRDLRRHTKRARRTHDLLALEEHPKLLTLEVLHRQRIGAIIRTLEGVDVDDVIVRQT